MLVLVLGNLGSGKTLFTTYLALNDSRAVFSNYRIKRDRSEKLTLENLFSDSLKDALVIIDEAYVWLESRASSSNVNRVLSYLLFQSRKKGIDIVLTSQLYSVIDVRFRELSDYYVVCKRKEYGFRYYITNKKRVLNTFVLTNDSALYYFDKYDTYQVILPTKILDFQVDQMSGDEFLKRAKELLDKIREKSQSRFLTKKEIRLYLRLLNESRKFTDAIYQLQQSGGIPI